jgi:predicted membrane channel-forming protein YqfA (hemolysin III family)
MSISQRKQYIANGHLPPPSHSSFGERPRLVSYEEIPWWYKDNEYILRGYRPESFSASACFASWGYIHNETFNIYSHLIPAILFLVAQIFVARLINQSFPDAKAADYIIFAFFLLTAFITLSTSFLYHTLMNHSMRISHLWLRLDFIGILFLTLGDFVSGIYLVFYCEPTLQKIYWAMVRLHRFGPTLEAKARAHARGLALAKPRSCYVRSFLLASYRPSSSRTPARKA